MSESASASTADDLVRVERRADAVTVVTLNRPHALNAQTIGLVRELQATLDAIASDPTCRVVILTGAGRGFCAGHDLNELGDGGGGAPSVQKSLAHQREFDALTVRIATLPQPVIAAVNGPAAGGGFALALAADTRVCSTSARFNAAFVRIGLSGCELGVSYLLPRIVGPTLAFEMMLTGRLVDAEEALSAGLVLRVVPDREVINAALAIADRIVANTPFGVRMTKQLMRGGLDAPSLQAAIEIESRTQVMCGFTRDQHEALGAFVEKRAPIFHDH